MRSNYKRIGDFIQLVDERNRNLEVTTLLGLSISKVFIPSVANIIGTDMENYKIIRKNQFACSTMQVRRDGKMPVALLKDFDEAIISPAYPVFEVVDSNVLLPEYLMMWFSRSEFDREACFYAVGGVRGSLEWEDFLDMKLPVPSPEKQRQLVNEYHVLVDRINLNNRLIQKLEETAQALYKEWFVDFEFPVTSHIEGHIEGATPSRTLNNKAPGYKSSGGEMVESEMGMIPKGWRVEAIGNISEIKAGGDRPNKFSDNKTNNCPIPIYSNGVTNNGLYGYTDKANYPKDCITVSARGTIGFCVLRREPFDAIVRLLVIIPKYLNSVIYLWQVIRTIEFDNSGSVQNQLTIPQISNIKLIFPSLEILNQYDSILKLIYQNKDNTATDNQKLGELKELLLSKLATIEN